jgi:hypothetical protein
MKKIDFAFGSNLIASVVFEQESSKRLLKNEHAQITFLSTGDRKGGGDALSRKLYVGHISSTRFAFRQLGHKFPLKQHRSKMIEKS